MMGFGLLTMFAVLVLPLVLIAGLVILLIGVGRNRTTTPPPPSQSSPGIPTAGAESGRVCSHCGARLQPDWAHCPQCGAPAGEK